MDDITQKAWAIVAQHLTRGQKDPTQMVADAIRLERAQWAASAPTQALLSLSAEAHPALAIGGPADLSLSIEEAQ